jgi:hypothetical protein
VVLGLALAACASNESVGRLSVSDTGACRDACKQAPLGCGTQCPLSCLGVCTGTMAASDFPFVDSVQCSNGVVRFQKGGSTLTCTP